MATDAELGAVRDWVGDTQPDDATIEATLARLGRSTDAAALSILRRRRVSLASSATQFAVAGDYSENRDGQIKALDGLITELEARTGESSVNLPTVTTGLLARPTRGR